MQFRTQLAAYYLTNLHTVPVPLSLYYFLVNTKVRAGLDDSRANAANSQGIVLGLTTNRAGANRSPLDQRPAHRTPRNRCCHGLLLLRRC